MLYAFRFLVEGNPPIVRERRHMDSDSEARLRAISELLQMPHRLGVEVWQGDRLIYCRRRGPKPGRRSGRSDGE